MSYTTYIFDFDYTLADSSRGIVMCYRHVLTHEGYLEVTDEQIKRTIGKTLEDSFSEMTGVTDPQHLASMKQQYVQQADHCMTANTHLFPETKEVLTRLKQQGARIAILSTKYRYRIEELVAREFSPGFFDLIVGGEDVQQMKPNPEGLLLALNRLHATAAETLYLGDSEVDALTAQAAGVSFAGVLHGVTTRQELATHPHVALYDNLRGLLSAASEPAAPRWVSWWELPVLYFVGTMALDEFTDDSDFPLFLLVFLLTFWWTLHDRRFLPLSLHRQLMQKFQPLKRWMRGSYLRVKRGKAIPLNTTQTTVCKCCGEIYQGNYCPRCGQPASTTRYRMSNAMKNIAGGFFNIDSGFGRTLIDLFYRPGHLIREFITGRRAFYFRPFQMLFILAALYIMAVQLVDPEALQRQQGASSVASAMEAISSAVADEAKDESSDAAEAKDESSLAAGKKDTANSSTVAAAPTATAAPTASAAPAASAAPTEVATEDEVHVENVGVEELVDLLTEEEVLPANSSKVLGRFNGDLSIKNRLRGFIESHPFAKRVVNLLEGWIHGNKAFLVLITLPLFALASRFVFRKPKYRPRFNLTEHLFVQAYIACQLLLISIVLLFIHGRAQVDDIYEVSLTGMFLIFCFVYRQLYNLSWWESLWRTTKMFLSALLLLVLLAIVVASVWVCLLLS